MAELHYTEYLFKVRGCALGLGDMTWIEPALRVIARSGMDFTAGELAQAYERGGALTPHFLRNMDRGKITLQQNFRTIQYSAARLKMVLSFCAGVLRLC